MVIIRPVAPTDLSSLLDLSSKTGVGLTTLPHDEEILTRRIAESQRGFARMADKPGGETYLFVMEDLDTGAVVGTSGLFSKVGGYEPFYAYRVETNIHESKVLKVRKEIKTLHLVMEHNGPSEIGSLFLAPEYRKASTAASSPSRASSSSPITANTSTPSPSPRCAASSTTRAATSSGTPSATTSSKSVSPRPTAWS
jgi:arginine/ornithine succinyltransferase subunit-like protein